jgi:hypothetical protein
VTGPSATYVGGDLRFNAAAELPQRIFGLLIDRACEALVVAATPDEITRHGIPHTRFDLAFVAGGGGISSDLRNLVAACAADCIEHPAHGPLKAEASRKVEALARCI